MSWKPLTLIGLSFNGQDGVAPAILEFRKGLNVVCGASDTGKSFIVEAIDFLLGSSSSLRDIPERVRYDRAKLAILNNEQESFTLQRSTSGGGFHKYDGVFLEETPSDNPIRLGERHAQGRDDTLSGFLLSEIDLRDKFIRRNQRGETRSLSFRDLARLILVQESEITKRNSPILSGQYTTKTAESSVFKLLLTGNDDSALVDYAEVSESRQNNVAKIEFVDELLSEWRSEISDYGLTKREAEEQFLQIQAILSRQQQAFSRVQIELNNRLERRRFVAQTLGDLNARRGEITALLSRFDLLKQHYQIDLERLSAIEESGSIFVHLQPTLCPLCGALPQQQHQAEECDGNIELLVAAANAEIEKIRKLDLELEQTVQDLRAERRGLEEQLISINSELNQLNSEIQETLSPAFEETQTSLTDLMQRAGEFQHIVEMFSRIEQLELKKSVLLASDDGVSNTPAPRVDLSTSVLDEFSLKIQQILENWGFPGGNRVHFDSESYDFVIGGQLRSSRGKGLRAITHAAINIGLFEFCQERGHSHPGFVVLDSPLLAYWGPEDEEDSLVGTDLKARFYEYLSERHADSQIIVIENEHPPTELEEKIHLTIFTKNLSQGRYGFFTPI